MRKPLLTGSLSLQAIMRHVALVSPDAHQSRLSLTLHCRSEESINAIQQASTAKSESDMKGRVTAFAGLYMHTQLVYKIKYLMAAV